MIRRGREARAEAGELAALVVSGELRLDVESFAFEDAADALERLAAGRLRGRAVLLPGRTS
jgi:D-arabinose 1-dehydrogenase-like Zn-dependent alcohol dehydrogenase